MYMHIDADKFTRFYPFEYTLPLTLCVGDVEKGTVHKLDAKLIKKIDPVGLTMVCVNYDGLMVMFEVAESVSVARYLNCILLKKFLYCPN